MYKSAATAVAVALLCTAACFEPSDRRAGTKLSGELVTQPVSDWSFTRSQREIFIETRTPYFIPHSVTILCADADGQLFVGARSPVGKRWVKWVERDPNVRLKIAGRLYDVRLSRISDAPGIERVRAAYAAKLGPPAQTTPAPTTAAAPAAPPAVAAAEPEIWYWRVDPRS